MTAVSQSFTTPGVSGAAYITLGEYMAAPTALDIGRLKVDGSVEDQRAVLYTLIQEASSRVEDLCNQPLIAQLTVEAGRVRVNRNSEINVNTKRSQILEVLGFQCGPTNSTLSALADLSNVWLDEQSFTISPAGLAGIGRLNQGWGYGSGRLMARWSYIPGFPSTILAAGAVNAGDTQISVIDSTGIYGAASQLAASSLPGPTQLVLSDPAPTASERVSVGSVVGNVLHLNSPLLYDHEGSLELDEQVGVSAMPPLVRKATVLLVNTLIQSRGDGAIVAPSIAQGGYNARESSPRSRKVTDANVELAKEWLQSFTVVA